jgi:adenylate cyclase
VTGGVAEAFLISAGGGRRFPLTGGQTWAIGRGEGCGVLLDSRSVSRLHALLQRRDAGDYYLVDLGSRNGSFVNGRRVSLPVRLEDRDRLAFAEQELIFRNPSGSGRHPTPPPTARNMPTETLQKQSLATIVVADIRDFTPLARTVSEALLAQTIGTWFLRVGQAAERWGSWAQQYIGDAVMAVWVHRDKASVCADLEKVLRAVCEFERSTSEISRTLPLPSPLRIGAGINTGPVLLGGTDYTALGETVNAAFRLEGATKSVGLSVILGEGAFAAWAKPEATPFRRCEVQLKGYETPITAWAISFHELELFVKGQGAPAGGGEPKA